MNLRLNKTHFTFFLTALSLFYGMGCAKKDEIASPTLPVLSPYISQIFEYKPAPGQFINDPSFGTLARAKELIGTVNNGLLSLGGFGGYVVFGFDHAIENTPGFDLGIYGNPLIATNLEWSEPGIVCVMQDKNGNRLPDDEWFELAGSEYNTPETIKSYRITYYRPVANENIKWTDNLGHNGELLKNAAHLQNWFPSWATANEISFEGTLLKNNLVDAGVITNLPFAFGYADNGSPNYLKIQNESGRGYNSFDIDWAVDATGNKVKLTKIDFVKVYTGQNYSGSAMYPVAEVSTEIAGAIDIKLLQK